MKYSNYDDKFAAMQRRKDEQGMSDWWCQYCGSVVQPEHVTYDERHDERSGGCGGPVHGKGEHVNTDNSAVIANMQEKIDALTQIKKAAIALHRRIVDLEREYSADDCFVINDSIAIDIMLLGGEDSELEALLEAEK